MNKFLVKIPENGDLNQYWYSKATIDAIVSEIEGSAASTGAHASRVAFLSTPSLYYSVSSKEVRGRSRVFDFDEQFSSDSGFVKFDFHHPDSIPHAVHGQFDLVVIDPPFITEEVWLHYAAAAEILWDPVGPRRALCSTIAENRELMGRLFRAVPCPFMPSIPHLVYQYLLYVNYPLADGSPLSAKNSEIPDDDDDNN